MGSITPLEIPTHCKAGVIYNPGPNFTVKVEDVPVPQPGMTLPFAFFPSTVIKSQQSLQFPYRSR
jgi:hypothetical protein